jgi:hypothetical protein
MFGQDPQKPYFTVAYTMEAPTTGTIHGLTVMACEMHAHSADTRPTEANSAASADGHQSDQGDSGTAAMDSPADAGADVIGNESRPGSSNVDTIAPQPDNLSVAANQPAAIVDTPPSLDTIRPHPENLSATVDRQAAITFESPSAVDSVSQVPEAVPSSAEAQAAAIARRNAEWEEIEERLPGAVLPKN